MSLHSRPSLGVVGRLIPENRVSLNAGDVSTLPESDFTGISAKGRSSEPAAPTNPLQENLIASGEVDCASPDEPEGGEEEAMGLRAGAGSSESAQARSSTDPMANRSTLSEQGCLTRMVYCLFCLRWYEKVFDRQQSVAPQMYRFHNIGLYCHYAGIGFAYGIAGVSLNFCFYFYDGDDNVCANSPSLVFLAWGFKIFYAMVTDRFRPFGSRRRVWMTLGWAGGIGCTIVLALIGDSCSVNTWLGLSIATQAFLMIADVPADGYSVELGQLEKEDERGIVLSTGQYIRFLSTMLAGVVQAVLVNGPKTNAPGCPIDVTNCWAWGLTVAQYYKVLALILILISMPIFFMREVRVADFLCASLCCFLLVSVRIRFILPSWRYPLFTMLLSYLLLLFFACFIYRTA